jgi:hypothetical protein
MPRDLRALLAELEAEGHLTAIATNARAQFGTPRRQYLGASLLPERLVPANEFKERGIKYRTVVANDGTRYSAVQKKKGQKVGTMQVSLGESDIGNDLTAEEYDALLELLQSGTTMQQMTRVLDWVDTTLVRSLIEHNERHRWQAIVRAQVTRTGDDGYQETVLYSNPVGHRINASSVWSNDANDPMDQIMAQADFMAGKGFTINRIIVPRPVMSILTGNAKIQARNGSTVINLGGTLTVAQQRANIKALAGIFNDNDLPAPEMYDLQFSTQTGTKHFLDRNVMVMVASTGRDETIDFGDEEELIVDTLGYDGIGRPAGQSKPGRVVVLEQFRNKPPRIQGEAWQTELPVIQEPEAISVIGAIS